MEVAAQAGSHEALHSALQQIEAPANELKEGLDHLESVSLLQKSSDQHQVGRSDRVAIGAALAKVHELLDRHEKVVKLIKQSGRRSGRDVQEAHSHVGKAIKKLRQSSESLMEVAAKKGSHEALDSALQQIEAPTNELKRGLEHLVAVCLIQKLPQKDRARKHSRVGHSKRHAAVNAAYDKVHNLLNRHEMITKLLQRGGHITGHMPKAIDVQKAHSTVGKAITKLREESESLMQIAAEEGSHEALHSALQHMEAPANELKKGLDHLESVSLLQRSSEHHQLGQSERLAAVDAAFARVHDLLDRHEKIAMLIQKSGRRSGDAVHEAHSTVGKAIRKLRQSSESLMEVAAQAGSHEALHSALLKIEAPANELKEGLDHLESVCFLQKRAAKVRRHGLASSELAALGVAYDHVHSLLDRHEKVMTLLHQDNRRSSRAAKQAHDTIRSAIKKLRQSSESLLGIATTSPLPMQTLLLQIEAPTSELKKGLDHLEGMVH